MKLRKNVTSTALIVLMTVSIALAASALPVSALSAVLLTAKPEWQVIFLGQQQYQTLKALVRNTGPEDIYVQIFFTIFDELGAPVAIVATSIVLIPYPSSPQWITADFFPLTVSTYYVEAVLYYSYDLSTWFQDPVVWTFKFKVFP